MTSIRLPVLVAALVGLLSMAAGLAVGHLVGGLTSPTASPFVAVGGSAIDLTPAWVKDFAIRTFGSNDKLALLVGMAVVIALVGVVAGLLSRRSRAPGLVVIVLLAAVATVAVASRPNAGGLDVFAPLAGLVASAGTFVVLHRLGLLSRQPAEDGAVLVPRRVLLAGSAAVAAGAGAAAIGGQLLTARSDVEGSRQAVGQIVPRVAAPSIPAGADFASDGSPTFITPNRDFYRVDINFTVPQLRAEDWRLRIHGMVDREITLNWADLTSRPLIERTVTMTCVSNEIGGPYISTSNFTGVLLADILDEAGVQPGADQVFTTSVDKLWTCGTPTSTLTDRGRQAMLVIGMNGEPLPVEHGFPVRMLVPGLYGFVSGTKWITDMELTTFDAKQAYWLERDWGQRAPIKTMSRIDSPGAFGRVGRDTPITGIAWAQTRGIEKVEVRLDRGEWQPAELSTEVNVDTWRMFRLRGRWELGNHVAEVRATDKTGYTQTADRVAPIPDGATGWHSVQFTVL